jgi:hypothetical protein
MKVQEHRQQELGRSQEAAAGAGQVARDRVRRVPLGPVLVGADEGPVPADLLTPRHTHFRPMHLQVWELPADFVVAAQWS